MKYITGIHALNLNCSLDTCGDWHTFAIQWDNPHVLESDDSIFGDYGIEQCLSVPFNGGTWNFANTLRALLDLLAEGSYSIAQGAREDFICNEKYTEEFMDKVILMRDFPNWEGIDSFMGKEYRVDWLNFKSRRGVL